MTSRGMISGTLTLIASLLLPVLAHAQTLRITPALIDAAHSVEQALEMNKSHASTTIEGKGGTLTIDYRSGEPLEVYMVPLKPDSSYVPTDYLHFTLPMSEQGTIALDLTVSPGWNGENQKWMMTLLGKSEATDAAFTNIVFGDGASPSALVAVRHLLTRETYTPSSYHGLRGYRFLGLSLTKMLGILTVIAALAGFAFLGNKRYRHYVLLALLSGSLLYQARFSLDLLRFTLQHTREYAQGTYDEAGSIHAVAESIRTLAKDPTKTTVYVCRDGTNFKEKLLRYFAYPVRISSDSDAAKNAQYAVVMEKFRWGFQTIVTKDESIVTLKCGDVDSRAQRLNTFPSGEILFKLLPAS